MSTNYQASKKLFSKIFQPMLVLIIAIFVSHYWTQVFSKTQVFISRLGVEVISYALACMVWFIIAWLVNGLIDIFLWDKLFRGRLKINVPSLIKDIVVIFVYFSVILCIATYVFDGSINGFLAASGLLGLVLGLAAKNLIADLFNGLALNFDHPFARGELLTLQGPTHLGTLKVIDTTWRTTRFETENNDILVVPNSKLGSMVITNLSKNSQGKFHIMVNVQANVPTKRALMLLESALKSSTGVLTSPEPLALIRGIKNNAIIYRLSYWLEPSEILPSQVKHNISMNILRLFNLAGFTLFKEMFFPSKAIEAHLAEPIPPTLFLPRISLFEKLTAPEIDTLAKSLIIHRYSKGSLVVELGAKGESLFIVVEGLLTILVKPSSGADFIQVGHLTSAEYFGEMSLLTGAPRMAQISAETDVILYEISREAITPLLKKRPELVEHFSQIIAEREAANEKKRAAASSPVESKTEYEPLSQQIARKIKSLFGFK